MNPEETMLVLLTGPPGAGKHSVRNALIGRIPFYQPATCTTRPMRAGEMNGREYVFISQAEFEKQEQDGAFAETATIHGHRYGTPRRALTNGAGAGLDSILILNVPGAAAIKRQRPDALAVFLAPGGTAELERRMRSRGMGEEEIRQRLNTARRELRQPVSRTFDLRVVSREGRPDRAAIEIISAIREHRERRSTAQMR